MIQSEIVDILIKERNLGMKTAFSASKRSHLLVLVVFLSCLQISPVTAKEPSLSNSEKNDY